MAVSKSNFFKDHYDWIVALVGIALLAGVGFLYATSLENTPEAARAACEAELAATSKAAKKGVPAPADKNLDMLASVEKGFREPTLLGAVSDEDGSFLASEHRVYCKNPKCRKPIRYKSKTCAWCRFEQPSENPDDAMRKGADLDEDGMTDEWEKRYGLDPNRNDANEDADGDLFTNLEEFNAQPKPTNPKDPEDHPDYLDDLTVGNLETEKLPFWFNQTEASGRDSFRAIFVTTDPKYDSKTRAGAGDELLWTLKRSKTAQKEKSGWRVVKVEKKYKRVKKAGAGQETEVEDSIVVLQRVSDKREFTVPLRVKDFPIEEQLELQWNRGEGKTFKVAKGTEFELNKRKYVVKAIRKGSATIIDVKTNTRKTIGTGAPGPKAEEKPASAAKPGSKANPKPQPKR